MTPLAWLVPVLVLLFVAVAVFLAAVWFGRRIITPPIQRALDRADEDDDPGD